MRGKRDGGEVVAGRLGETELLIVSYDVVDDRRRTRLHKLLLGYGTWVQYSVFECYLTKRQQVELLARVKREVNRDQDRVRIYRMCGACEGRVEAIGSKPPTEAVAYVV